MTTKRNLCKIKGLSEMKVDKIREAAAKLEVGWKSMSLRGGADGFRTMVSLRLRNAQCDVKLFLGSQRGQRSWTSCWGVRWWRWPWEV